MAKMKSLVSRKPVTCGPVVVLTNVKDLKVEFLNPSGDDICDLHVPPGENNANFYKDNVHPDDYPLLRQHFASVSSSVEAEEQEIMVRLKSQTGCYSKFRFKTNFYVGDALKGEKLISLLEKDHSEEEVVQKEFILTPASKDYLQLVNSLDEGFAVIDLIYNDNGDPVDYIYLQVNPAFENQVNWKNVIGKKGSELVKVPNQQWLKTFAQVVRTGKAIRFEGQNHNHNNSWFNMYAFKVDGPNTVAILFKNVTSEKLAEQELEEARKALEKSDAQSSMLLQTVFETTNLGIAVLSNIYDNNGKVIDFKYLRLNHIMQEMYVDGSPVGKTMLAASKHGVQLGIFDALKKVAETGEPLDTELYFDKDGYNNWFRITAIPQKDLIIASIEDITQRKEESLELEETIRFKQQLVRTSPETIMIVNLNNFNVRYINKDLFPQLGMTRERILGMSLPDILPFVHPRDREKVMDMHRKLLKASERDVLDLELRLKVKGNQWHWFSVRAKVFHRRDENWVDEYVLLVRNINEQKITQKALLKAEKFSIQGEIARTLAHELRNPLASIKMTTEVLGKKLPASEVEDFQKYLNILSRSTDTLNRLVTNLLTSSNYTPAELEKEDLAEVVEETLLQAADRIYLTGMKIVKNFKGPYPVLADKEKLKIALLNIIVNANEATVPGEGVIEVSITEEKTDFRLDIADNGHGLEKDQIDRLFEAFYTNKHTGVGVGLSSVKNILEEHDAHIEVKSKPNEGTCFSLFFNNLSKES